MEPVATRVSSIRVGHLSTALVISVVTMPLTFFWCYGLGLAAICFSPLAARSLRDPIDRVQVMTNGVSVGLGLLVGPAIYVGLAVSG